MFKSNFCLISLVFFSVLLSQVDYNFSYELKYGMGSEIKKSPISGAVTSIDDSYGYNEHLLNVNLFYEDVYLFGVFEWSDPPVFGEQDSPFFGFNRLFLEYETDNLYAKIGNLEALYGRGLALGLSYDEVIDFDSTVNGAEFRYSVSDDVTLFTLNGYSNFEYRTSTELRQSDQNFGITVNMAGIEYSNETLGDFQVFGLRENQEIYDKTINSIDDFGKNYFAWDLGDRLFQADDDGTYAIEFYSNGDNLDHYLFDFNHNFLFQDIEVYYELVSFRYEKLASFNKYETGLNKYLSIYKEFGSYGVTYEYKDYYSPMRLKTISSPPTVFKETNSSLLSRTQHKINFLNESGHQIEVNRKFSNSFNLLFNLSLSSAVSEYEALSFIHPSKDQKMPFLNYFSENFDSPENLKFKPYRQVFLQADGLIFSKRLYYKVGIDFSHEISVKNIKSFTLPTHFAVDFFNKRSIVLYYEYQSLQELKNVLINTETHYISTTFNYLNWHLSLFCDMESKDLQDYNFWLGTNLAWKFNSSSMVSIFYGSQKGGLICANGVCAQQPDFDNGVKLSLRTNF